MIVLWCMWAKPWELHSFVFKNMLEKLEKFLSKSTICESVKLFYVAIAKHGFESFRCFPIEHVESNFSHSKEFYKAAWPWELYWIIGWGLCIPSFLIWKSSLAFIKWRSSPIRLVPCAWCALWTFYHILNSVSNLLHFSNLLFIFFITFLVGKIEQCLANSLF